MGLGTISDQQGLSAENPVCALWCSWSYCWEVSFQIQFHIEFPNLKEPWLVQIELASSWKKTWTAICIPVYFIIKHSYFVIYCYHLLLFIISFLFKQWLAQRSVITFIDLHWCAFWWVKSASPNNTKINMTCVCIYKICIILLKNR